MLSLPIKKYLIIGSYALGVRAAKDIDVVCYRDDVEVEIVDGDEYAAAFMWQGRRIELLFADKQESLQVFLREAEEDGNINEAAYPITLLAIKAGHITFPHRQWEKHIMDYHILKASFDGKGYTWLNDATKLHKKSTEDRLGKQKLPKLKGVSKEEFFDDFVVKYVEHDDIHQMVAHKEKPMYSYMQHDPTSVECDKKLWEVFPFEDKIHCVMEECYVIALERHIIPTMKGDRVGMNYHDAFKWALYRVCTTLCSGWFRQFAIDNYFNILNNYNKEYYKLLKL